MRWGTTLSRRVGLCLLAVVASIAFNGLVELCLPAQWHRTLAADAYAFALGIAAAAIVVERRPSHAVRLALVAGGWALVAVDALAHVPWDLPGHDVWWDLPAALGFAAVVAAAASGRGLLLGSAPMRWLGERSYGLYLVHYPVILRLTSRHSLPPVPLVALGLVLAVSLALAEVFLRGIERPGMRLALRLQRRGTAAMRRPALEVE